MNYGSAAGFADYHESRGTTLPGTWDDDAINAALLAASEWLDGVYEASFIGYKKDGFLQDRSWPRTSAVVCRSIPNYIFANTDIPERVVQATYEAAFRQMTTPGSLQVDYKPGKYKSVQVEGAIRVEYANPTNVSDVQNQIAVVDTLLWPLLDDGSGALASGLSGSTGRA